MNTFYTIEIPHTFPARVSTWLSKQDAVGALRPLDGESLTDEQVFEAAGDDLNNFLTFETLKELDDWSRRYASDSRAGGCGGHQSARIRTQVEAILEDSLEEVMGSEPEDDDSPEPSNPKNTKITVELHDLDECGVPTRATIVVNKLNQYGAPLLGISGTDERMSAGGESPILQAICEVIREEHTALTGIDYLNADGTVCDAMGTPREEQPKDQHLEQARALTIKEIAYWALKNHYDDLGDYLDLADEGDGGMQDVLTALTNYLEPEEDRRIRNEDDDPDFYEMQHTCSNDDCDEECSLEFTAPVSPEGAKQGAEGALLCEGCSKKETAPRKHSTPEDRLSMIHDPSHGWLVVPIADVEASGIEVSRFSYKDSSETGNYYLEEDCDASAYLTACGYKFGPDHSDHIDIEHKYYESIDFENGAVRCVKEN